MSRSRPSPNDHDDRSAARVNALRGKRRYSYNLVSMVSDLSLLLDPLCLFAAAALSTWLYTHWFALSGIGPTMRGDFTQAALVAAVLAPFILFDKRFGAVASRGDMNALMHTHLMRYSMLALMVIMLGALSQVLEDYPRHWLATWYALSLVLTALTRMVMGRYVRRLQRRGALAEVVAVVGAGPVADRLVHSLRQTRSESVELLGVFDDRVDRLEPGAALPTGSIEQLIELGKTRKIDWILLTLPPMAEHRVHALVQRLKALSVPIGLCPQHVSLALPYHTIDYIGDNVPVGLLAQRPAQRWEDVLKAAEDFVPRWIVTLVLVPFMVLDALTNMLRTVTWRAPQPGPARLACEFDAYDVAGFAEVAAGFGSESFAYVVTPNADHLIRLHEDATFRELYATAGYILLDSRFLSHLLRLTRGIRLPVCPGSDLTARLFADVIDAEDRLVLIGGTAEQAGRLAELYGLRNLAHFNPPMGFIRDPKAVEDCLRFVEAHSPFRFCLLAVGAPQQEAVAQMLKSRGVARGLALCIGASINFLTGDERRAPVWMQRCGVEWLFRLMLAPRRMASRYLVRGPRVFALLRHAMIGVRKRAPVSLRLVPPSRPAPLDALAGAAPWRGKPARRKA